MEVHPPEHGIHSWRDFLVHMGTITLGLLIALSLEATVEWVHHHRELNEARERVHAELEENRRVVAEDRAYIQHATERMRANIAVLDAPGPVDTRKLKFGWIWNSPSNSAWDSARTTGVLALMPYDEVERYSSAYEQQAYVVRAANEYVGMQVRLVTPLMRRGDLENGTVLANLSPEERNALANSCAESLTQMGLLIDLTNGLNNLYGRM